MNKSLLGCSDKKWFNLIEAWSGTHSVLMCSSCVGKYCMCMSNKIMEGGELPCLKVCQIVVAEILMSDVLYAGTMTSKKSPNTSGLHTSSKDVSPAHSPRIQQWHHWSSLDSTKTPTWRALVSKDLNYDRNSNIITVWKAWNDSKRERKQAN